MYENKIAFFLGANLKEGFVSYFDTLHNLEKGHFTYIIKGGPGTGKSGLMKRIAKHFEDKGFTVIYIPCSSDPLSLDGIIIPKLGVSLADGTAPHVMDPVYPGCRDEIVNVGSFWKGDFLAENEDEIISASKENKALLKKAARFISAAAEMQKDTFHCAFETVDSAKLGRFTTRFSARNLPTVNQRTGQEYRCLISGITPVGRVIFKDTVTKLADEIIAIEDEYGAASRMIIESVKASAILAGYDVIACYCPLHPKTKAEHLIIPKLSLAITTSNAAHRADFEGVKRIHASRFYNKKLLDQRRERIIFNRKATVELVGEASDILAEAKLAHDKLEKNYIEAMDFSALDRVGDKLIEKIEKRV